MSSGLTAIKIGETTFPIDFSQHNHDDRYITKNVTYAELVELRNNSQLTPGRNYRITDYVTTVSGSNALSAENGFDIIVKALTENVLSNDAYAIQRFESDSTDYFANENLSEWKLKYSLDNDSNKFTYANTSGTGTIYRMIDEYGNSLPYDFKNVIWVKDVSDNPIISGEYYHGGTWYTCALERYAAGDFTNEDTMIEFECWKAKAWNGPRPSYLEYYVIKGEELSSTSQVFYYDDDLIFNNASSIFGITNTLTSLKYFTFGNIESIDYEGPLYDYTTKHYNGEYVNCENNVFGNYCYSNSFGNGCSENSFGNSCSENSFGNNCNSNSFGNNCNSNSFENHCSNNSFGSYCSNNSFGSDCYDNFFGNLCSDSFFENDCIDNSFVVDEFRELLFADYGSGSGSGEEIGAFEEVSEISEENTDETGA